MKKLFLPILNILIPIVCFTILLFAKLSDELVYFMVMSLVLGWTLPFIVLVVTGISMFNIKKPKLTLVYNTFSVLLTLLFIFLISKILDKNSVIMLVEYIITGVVNIVNIIYFSIYIKKHPDEENLKIKKIKKENNGAIV